MSEQEQHSVMTVCLMAAFADGAKDDRERDQIKRIAESLAPGSPVDMTGLYQDVLLNRRTVEDAASGLASAESRQFAYEMAVCVCDADGARTPAEAAFLEKLHAALGLDAGQAGAFARQADEMAATPLHVGATANVSREELDKSVLNYSILNGALELLPQSLASMAILPLQMKMVYAIGKAYGYELDREHIKEFAATLGVGFTGQYVEQFGRKLIGGLLGAVGGGLLRGLGSVAAGSAFSFATTYALGQVAIQYYSAGRTIDMEQLKQVFAAMFDRGKSLQNVHSSDILQRARTLDLNQISNVVRQF